MTLKKFIFGARFSLSCEKSNLKFYFRSDIILVLWYLTEDSYALKDIKYKLRSVMDMELAPTPMFKSKKQIELEDDNVSISPFFLRILVSIVRNFLG